MTFSKIQPIALGVSVGILSGLVTFLMGFLATVFFTGKPIVAMMGSMYLTYNPSLANSAVGAAVVAVNAFIGGYISAWIYNLLLKYL